MDILAAENIVKQYTGHMALDDVTIRVPRGSVYGLLGPNGAGKTTLIRIINRIAAPDSGRLIFDGRPMTGGDVMKIGYLPEERGLYKKMKVGEQALYLSRLKGLDRSEAMTELKKWFRKFGIQGWWDRKVEELSKGMAQKVQFIVTVIHKPELLIFDEPFSGFDPINTQMLKEEILELRDNGSTIIFSTHNMSSVEEICDHITLINKSRNVLDGRVDEIRRSYGANSYRLDFTGDGQALEEALAGKCGIARPETAPGARLQSFVITPHEGFPPRGILAQANDRVEIRNFSEMIPSMNEIFIRVVGENAPVSDFHADAR